MQTPWNISSFYDEVDVFPFRTFAVLIKNPLVYLSSKIMQETAENW